MELAIPPNAAETLRWLAWLCAAVVLGVVDMLVTAKRKRRP